MSDAAAASAAASSSSEASPAWKQLQHREAAPFSPTPPPPSSRKLRTMPSRHNELGSEGKSSFSPAPGTVGSRSAGETRSTCRSNSRFRRDLGGAAAGDGSIGAAALMASRRGADQRNDRGRWRQCRRSWCARIGRCIAVASDRTLRSALLGLFVLPFVLRFISDCVDLLGGRRRGESRRGPALKGPRTMTWPSEMRRGFRPVLNVIQRVD